MNIIDMTKILFNTSPPVMAIPEAPIFLDEWLELCEIFNPVGQNKS